MIALQMYLGAVIQFQTAMPTLLLQVFEFPVTARQTIGAIEVVDTQRLIAEPVGAFNQVARVRRAV